MENRIPPVIVMLLVAALMWLLNTILPVSGIDAVYRIVGAVIVAGGGACLCVAGVAEFRRVRTTVNPLTPDGVTSLVTSGIYRYSRNPMYVGFALFLVALAVLLGSLWSLLGVMTFVLYMNRFQIEPEERALAQLFGEEFVRYKSEVRRWI